jgi:hypothetical protein
LASRGCNTRLQSPETAALAAKVALERITWVFIIQLPAALGLLLAGLIGITGNSSPRALMFVIGLLALGMGTAFACFLAYTFAGRMELDWQNGTWHITTRLWRWSRARTIRASEIRCAEVAEPGPGGPGPHVRLHLYRTDRVEHVAAGLCLCPDVLDAFRELLAARGGL